MTIYRVAGRNSLYEFTGYTFYTNKNDANTALQQNSLPIKSDDLVALKFKCNREGVLKLLKEHFSHFDGL